MNDRTEYINHIRQTISDNFSVLTGDAGIENWNRELCQQYIEEEWEIGEEEIFDGDTVEQYIEDILDLVEEYLRDEE